MDINIESISKRKENVLQKLPEIQNKNERQREIKLKPSKKKMLVAADIVRKYILKHKRKIYGGMAIDLSIKRKNKAKSTIKIITIAADINVSFFSGQVTFKSS